MITNRADGVTHKPSPRPPAPWWRLAIRYAAGLAAFAFVLSLFVSGSASQPVSYTEFKHLVRDDKVAEVVIGKDRIRGALKTPDHDFTTVRVDDPGLLDDLDQHAIT